MRKYEPKEQRTRLRMDGQMQQENALVGRRSERNDDVYKVTKTGREKKRCVSNTHQAEKESTLKGEQKWGRRQIHPGEKTKKKR